MARKLWNNLKIRRTFIVACLTRRRKKRCQKHPRWPLELAPQMRTSQPRMKITLPKQLLFLNSIQRYSLRMKNSRT
jgi:hypothetical protein